LTGALIVRQSDGGKLKDYFLERLGRLAPFFITSSDALPPLDQNQIEEFSREFIFSGTPAFRWLYYVLILAIQALCILMRRKSIYRLSPHESEEFLRTLSSSRLAPLSAIPTILGMPVYMAHYSRDDIQVSLGFDVFALREEAASRGVSR
jgi:hypothetical protein